MLNEGLKITKYQVHEPFAGEIIDVMNSRSPNSTEKLTTEYMCSDLCFTMCLSTIQSYSNFLSELRMPGLFDFPEDGFYKRDILNIVSTALENNPEWRDMPLNNVMIAALMECFNPKN